MIHLEYYKCRLECTSFLLVSFTCWFLSMWLSSPRTRISCPWCNWEAGGSLRKCHCASKKHFESREARVNGSTLVSMWPLRPETVTSKRQLLNQVLKEWDPAGQGQGERGWQLLLVHWLKSREGDGSRAETLG